MQIIECDDMTTYYGLVQRRKALAAKFGGRQPGPDEVTVEEAAIMGSRIDPPPLQVVVDFWMAEICDRLGRQ